MIDAIEDHVRDFLQAQTAIFQYLSKATDEDEETMLHNWSVARLSAALAEKYGLSAEQIADCFLGGLFHDIGKIAVPTDLMHSPRRLTAGQRRFLGKHTSVGHHICDTLGLHPRIGRIVEQHHERFDGSGYPLGLKADQIDKESQIVALADLIDGMACQEGNRPPYSRKQIIRELKLHDERFDPAICAFAIDMLRWGYSDSRWPSDPVAAIA